MTVNIMGWSTAADNPYGVTHGAFTPVAANGSVNYIDPQLFIDANAAGMSRVRLQLSAILIETANGVFDWRYLDDAVQKANAAGLRVTFPIREFGPKGLPNQSWATMSSPCGPGESYYYGTVTNWVNFAVALAQRYSGDGNPNNKLATDGSGRPLIIDSIEIGNEDFDVHGSTSDDCRNPMRYVQYARAVANALRTPVSQGGGGWIQRPSDNFTARIGMWGCWWQNQVHIQNVLATLHNPPTDSTYNPNGDHSSVISLLSYLAFHNYQAAPSTFTSAPYTFAQELQDMRSFLDSHGYTTTPVWITEFGSDGPAGTTSAQTQSNYYNDSTGHGALQAARDGNAQHIDLFTISYDNNTATAPYIGDPKSIACKTTSGTYVRFQAFTTVQTFITNNPTFPYGFSGNTGGTGGGTGGSSSGVPHVMVVMMENRAASEIVGNTTGWPHVNTLLSTYGYASSFYAEAHPSLPNYLAFASGSTHGVTTDTYDPSVSPISGNTLVDSLIAVNPPILWKHYAEGLPSVGYLGGDTANQGTTGYVEHHNPWVYFSSIRSNSSQYNRIVPYADTGVGLQADLNNGTAPPFLWVQPDDNDNGHNSGTSNDQAADTFVNGLVTMVQASTWYTNNGGIILLVWDEGASTDTTGTGDASPGGGQTLVVSIASALSGVNLSTQLNHYGLLRGIEALYGLPYLNNSAHTTNGNASALLPQPTSSGSASAQVASSSLSFSATSGGGNPASQQDTLTNSGSVSGAYSTNISYLSSASGWLAVTPGSGTLTAGQSAAQTFTVTTGSLSAGTYAASVTFTVGSSTATVNVSFVVSAASGGGGSTAGPLPGQIILSNGVSNFVFGNNMTEDYGSTSTIRYDTTKQALIKSAGYTLMRCAIPSGSTNAYIDLTAQACANMGCAMLVILTHNDPTWNQSMVTYLGSRCNLYEFGNEPDLYGNYTGANYLADWNTNIPPLRAINPQAAFGGPVMGVYDNLAGWLNTWLPGCVQSGVLPDFISYHIYPCTGDSSSTSCAAKPLGISNGVPTVNAQVQSLLGHTLPLGMTEWNIDAAAAESYITDQAFIDSWIPAAFDGIVNAGFALACIFDASSNAGGGLLDMINMSSDQPQYTYNPMASEITKWNVSSSGSGSGQPLTATPSNLSFTAVAGSNPTSQQITLTNPNSSTVSYSAASTQSWVTVTPTTGSINAGSSQVSTIGINTSGYNPGTYVTQIAYSANGVLTYVNVTLIVTASGGSTNPLSMYLAKTASTSLSTADALYTTPGNPLIWANYSRVGTATGYGEITSQGTLNPWASGNTIGTPTGNGFLYDSTSLEAQQLIAGTWSAILTLSAAQAEATQAGQLTADIIVRAYKWNLTSGVYTAILSMTLSAQAITSTPTHYTFPGASASSMSFATGDKLYIDIWANVTANSNNSAKQDIKLGALSNDPTGKTGSANALVVTPGYTTPSGSGNGTPTIAASPSLMTFSGQQGGTDPASQSLTLTNTGTAVGTWTSSISYVSGNGWLSQSLTTDTLNGGASENITLSATMAELGSGTYTAIITFVMGSTTSTVQVTLNIATSTFITRSGDTLYEGAAVFRGSGANVYWLGLLDVTNTGATQVRYPTTTEIDDALNTAKEMGASVIRARSLGVSVGNALSVWPALNQVNTQAFAMIDYAIYRAGQLGLRLIIPLTDNGHTYMGGKHTFTDWRGITDETQFYSNAQVMTDFEAYIGTILNRVNTYNNLAYKNDPTILAWETGNELQSPTPSTSWTTSIANYIKQQDTHHLVMDGSYGINSAALSLAPVDLYSNHFFPLNTSQMTTDAATVSAAGKAYFVGSYDWTGTALATFLSTIETTTTIAGDCFHHLQPHDDSYGYDANLTGDSDALVYPGTTQAMLGGSQALRTHGYILQGIPATATPSAGAVASPILTSVAALSGGGVQLTWRGVAGGQSYDLESSPAGSSGNYSTLATLTDLQAPFTDSNGTSGTWYRIRAFNVDNVAGSYSAAAFASSGGGTSGSGNANVVLTSVGHNLLRDGLSGANTPLISYVSLGTSNATPQVSDTQLGNEVFRKAVSSYVNGNTGDIYINMYLAQTDAVGVDIEEVGFWGGNATATPGSGVLLVRGLYSQNGKTNTQSFTFQLNIQL